jgi:hypothetical protein
VIKRIIALIGAAACTGLVVFFDCALLKGFTLASEQRARHNSRKIAGAFCVPAWTGSRNGHC